MNGTTPSHPSNNSLSCNTYFFTIPNRSDAIWGSSAEVMYQHQHAPLPVEQLNGIPQPLVVLLEVLLAKDPVGRFRRRPNF